MADRLEAFINGNRHDRWESVRVSRTIESVADSFSLSMGGVIATGGRPLVRYHKGTTLDLRVSGDGILNGRISQVSAQDDGRSASITYAGRSLAGDLVDASAEYRAWKKRTPLQIANDIAGPFDLAVTTDVADLDVTAPLERFAVEEGERAMETLARIATLRGLLITSEPDGQLLLTRAGAEHSGEALVRGQNILSASYGEDESEQFSLYVVKGQNAGKDTFFGEDAAHGVAKAQDLSVDRHRPLVITSEVKASKPDLERRAKWERNTRAGRAITYQVQVLGWRGGTTGRLWRENRLVHVRDPWYGIDTTMLIVAVDYERSASSPSTVTTLRLMLPQAFQPNYAPTPKPKPKVKVKTKGLAGLGEYFVDYADGVVDAFDEQLFW